MGACTATDAPSLSDDDPSPVDSADEVLRLHVVGDSLLHAELLDVGDDFGDLLEEMKPFFVDDDLTMLNLECPASDLGEAAADRPFALRCDPAGLDALARGGVDVVSIANDASTDYGFDALDDTVAAAEQAGLTVVGYPDDAVTLQRRGQNIAVLAFSTLGPLAEPPSAMADAVVTASQTHDLVVVSVHWGEPEDRDPNPDQIALAERLTEAGADAVYGHGPHRLQSLRSENGVAVVYSLGHFVWPLNNERDPDTAVAYTEVDENGVVVTCLLPATIRTSGRPAIDRPDAGCDIGEHAARASADE